MTRPEFNALLDKYLSGAANEEEIGQLSRYYNSFQQSSKWNDDVLGSGKELEAKLLQRIQDKIRAEENPMLTVAGNDYDIIDKADAGLKGKTNIFIFLRMAVAACVIGFLVYGVWAWLGNNTKEEMAQQTTTAKPMNHDVGPGGDKAVLRLGDGRTIVLDDAQNGALAQQGATKVIKIDGKLNYDASAPSQVVHFNTLSTPKGGKYRIALADGTQVWLNAASSLYFPTAFTGKERRVEITGEAYFEVAANKDMPFVVSVNGAEVQVLGTHFNVMAYADEASLNTTLIEGSVRFVKNDKASILKPGQQLQFQKTGTVKVLDQADIEAVLAWKNGVFQFYNTELQNVMRQLERWYDIEVDEKAMPAKRFNGNISRDVPLSKVLKMMEVTSGLQFNIENVNREGKLIKRVTIKQ